MTREEIDAEKSFKEKIEELDLTDEQVMEMEAAGEVQPAIPGLKEMPRG
jgi:hypothetical protein